MTVNGGTYTLGSGSETNLFYMVYTSGSGMADVKNGSFVRNVNNTYGFFYADDSSSIRVSNGSFTNSVGEKVVYTHGDVIATGGTFSHDPTPYVNSATHVVTGPTDGKYTVAPRGAENSEAKIGDTYYATLADAIEGAAQTGDTVTLLKNTTVDSTINLAKSLTLDLNGHVLTAATQNSRMIWITAETVNLTINGTAAGSGITMGDTHEASNSEKVWGFVDLRSGSDGSTVTVNGGSYTGSTCANDNNTYGAMFMKRTAP